MGFFEYWLPGLASGSSLALWIAAGILAAVALCAGAAFAIRRALQTGASRRVLVRGALVLAGLAVVGIWLERAAIQEHAAARRALDVRAAELTVRAIAPGSALACLDAIANASVEAACERTLFASPEAVAAAVAYVDARLTLLADGLALAARDRGYEASLERLRRAVEADRFGVVAHVLATRGCSATDCPAFKLLRDPGRVVANLKDRTFDANVVLHATSWRDAPALAGHAPPAAAPGAMGLAAAPGASAPTGVPVSGKYDFPSAASIPPVSIMNAEPAAPEPPPATGSSGQRAPSAAPPRRQSSAREAAPAAPVPPSPPAAGATLAQPGSSQNLR
jgi:hypothetical protein